MAQDAGRLTVRTTCARKDKDLMSMPNTETTNQGIVWHVTKKDS